MVLHYFSGITFTGSKGFFELMGSMGASGTYAPATPFCLSCAACNAFS